MKHQYKKNKQHNAHQYYIEKEVKAKQKLTPYPLHLKKNKR